MLSRADGSAAPETPQPPLLRQNVWLLGCVRCICWKGISDALRRRLMGGRTSTSAGRPV